MQLIYNNQLQQQAAKQTLAEEPLPKDDAAGDMMAECEAGAAPATSIHENGPAHAGLQLSPIVEVSQEYYRWLSFHFDEIIKSKIWYFNLFFLPARIML